MTIENDNDFAEEAPTDQHKLQSLTSFTHVIYALQVCSFFTGITALIAVICNYVRKDDVRGTWLESHFRWQIRTFWFGLLWTVLGSLTYLFIIGAFILFANFIWLLYRVIKGWLDLSAGKPMYRR